MSALVYDFAAIRAHRIFRNIGEAASLALLQLADRLGEPDPLVTLWSEHREIERQLDRDDYEDEVPLMDRLIDIEEEIAMATPATPAGAAVLLLTLRHRCWDYQWDEDIHQQRIFGHLFAWLCRDVVARAAR